MKLSVITQRQDIDAAQTELERVVRRSATGVYQARIGWPGGNELREAVYVAGLDLWFACKLIADRRWWNGFGFGNPQEAQQLSVVAEVNPSLDGSRQSAGAFLRDDGGKIWLAHSGRVGGGKKGVGKAAFLEAFTGSVQSVEGHDYVVIGRLDADDFLESLAAFVRTVQRFKASVGGGGQIDEDEIDDAGEVSDEGWGLDEVLAGIEVSTGRILLEWFGAGVVHAHAQSPACWAVTGRDGPLLRLLVGNTVAFEVGRGRVGLGLHLPTLADTVDASPDTGKPDFPFARVDGGVMRWLSLDAFPRLHEDLRPAALRFIELAAAAYRKTPYARYHVPKLLGEIAAALGVDLPRPAHAAAEVAPSYWKVAPGEKARLWDQCRAGGYIAIGWDELGDLSGIDRDGFDERLDAALREHPGWKRRGVEQAWRFINIPIGAKIVANDGTRRVVGIGTVTGPYEYVDDGKEFAHRLPVDWDDVRERVVEQPGWMRTVIQLSPAIFSEVAAAPSPGQPVAPPPAPEADAAQRTDFRGIIDRLEAAKLQFPDELVASYLLALQAKRFVILSGISGTGKTQLAVEVAKAFQPSGAVENPAASKIAEPEDAHRLRVQPYMLKFRRIVVPAVLAESVKGDAVSGRVLVRFGDGQSESLKWSAASTATQLLFKGAFREWFAATFEPGDELELRVEADDPPVLSVAAVRDAASLEASDPRAVTYAVVAVRPDWTDNRGLLGYYNPITREYHTTPFLRLLLAATDEWNKAASAGRPPLPFFVVLDEMNLARVEHYFSDFLSCVESGEPLHLHDDPVVAEGGSEAGELVPMQIGVPRNLFFTGTVNVDETTYMFSPKVLDRAFVLEFNDVDLEALAMPSGDDESEDTSVLRLTHFAGALDIREKASREDYRKVSIMAERAIHRALCSLNARLQAEHRHFGYRVANEIARFIGLAVTQAGKDPNVIWEALDVAVLAKVLPKIHGTQQEVEDVLGRLLAFAVDVDSGLAAREHEAAWAFLGGRIAATAETQRAPRLPRTAAKLWRMLRRARLQGYVSFIE